MTKRITVKDIVKAYLTEHGYDGLYNEDGGCACNTSDPFPCCCEGARCSPGYKRTCDGTAEGCEIGTGEGVHWHIQETRP
jgi:hypothetical protein